MAVDDMITFRTAAPVDIPVLQRLADRIWREHYPGIITQEQIDYMLAMMYASAVIEDEIERQGYHYVIVDDRNEPVGFIAYRLDEQERTVKIGKLYLLPSRQGKGIGRQMLHQIAQGNSRESASGVDLLSNRELQVIQYIGESCNNQIIAKRMQVSVKTVEAHRSRIKDKLKLNSSYDLIRFAVRWVEHDSNPTKLEALS